MPNKGKEPKEPPRRFLTNGLANAWEGINLLRARVREQGTIMLHPKSQKVAALTIKNARLNAEVLKPALVRLRVAGGKMPGIDDLISECRKLYEAIGREVASTQASKDGWTIRRTLSWLKRKAAREEVSQDPL